MHARDMEIRVTIEWPMGGPQSYTAAYRIPEHEYEGIRPLQRPIDPWEVFAYQQAERKRRAQIDHIAQMVANTLAAALEKGEDGG